MKTDELITLLARDASPVQRGMLAARLSGVALLGATAAFLILVPWLGIRPDLAQAVGGMTFWMKATYTAGLGVAGFALVERLSRPGAKGRIGWAVLALFIVAIVAMAISQLMATSPDDIRAVFMGSSWDKCPWRILVLSLPGLATILWVMRGFAPTRPTLSGAAAGVLAGGIAATVYGLHCQEIAAPFVALWYSAGIALSGVLGALVGSRLLRW